MRPGEPSPPRPAVLGHRMQQVHGTDVYRLVVEGSGEVLAEGGHDLCAEALVQRLLDLHGSGHPNWVLPTLGAQQFWADGVWFAGWRIQENVLSGHHRLLDPNNRRHAWGSRSSCRAVLERERLRRGLRPDTKPLVVLLHGLGRTRSVWGPMGEALLEQGYQVAALTYPSTRRTIGEHGDQLNLLIDQFEGPSHVSFVTHSLGALVVRSALAAEPEWTRAIQPHRAVMIAPPSRGSGLAQALGEFLPFAMIAGPAGQELARDHVRDLPAPPCPFGIIAAGRGTEEGFNPLLPGDDDGILSVEETRLAGAADHIVLEGLHTFIMKDPRAIAATLSFLKTGEFKDQTAPSGPSD